MKLEVIQRTADEPNSSSQPRPRTGHNDPDRGTIGRNEVLDMPQKFGLCGHCLKPLNSSRPALVRAVVQTRQADCELGIFPDMTIHFDCAVMLLGNNVVADR